MKSNDKHEIQKAIKEYIGSIGEDKIEKYHVSDMELAYKQFSDDFLKKVSSYCKGDDELKAKVNLIKKEKKQKEQDKLDFACSKAEKITEVIRDTTRLADFLSVAELLTSEIEILKKRDTYEIWLDWAFKNSRRIQLATHVAKLTHSSSQSSSVDLRFYDNNFANNVPYLITEVSNRVVMDLAYPDNALSSVAKLYNIFVCGYFVGDLLRDDGTQYLSCFSSEEKVSKWAVGFREGIRDNNKSSSFLSKQIYFPVDDENYHLLMPLVSSSMAHALFVRFKDFFNDENTAIREQKNKNKFHEELAISYPNRATLNVTGSNHSNASSLNGKRGGRLALLSSKPPEWQSKQQLPLSQDNLFNKQLHFKLNDEIKVLQKLLLIIKSKEVGINKPSMHKAVVLAVNEIADRLFDEVVTINLLSDEKGWTQKSCFPLSQQLLLEPCRDDEAVIAVKTQWQAELAEDFSYWLNKQLQHKKLDLTPIQQALWREIFRPQLRAFIAIQEVE
ncbi:MAG: type I-F CRISPR-associated protein Csy1 [Methylomarinum sp.]|nr:type I-F CRISPR-associated protein Csy1 [Methylomarinum sp.]